MTTYADPNGNGTATGWTNTYTNVDDAVRQPTAPSDGLTISGTTTDETAETLLFTDATFVAGATYTLWVYGTGGTKRAVDAAYSYNGSDPGLAHATRAQLIAAGGAAGWYSRVLTAPANQTELSALRVEFIANSTAGGGGATAPTVNAVYIQIEPPPLTPASLTRTRKLAGDDPPDVLDSGTAADGDLNANWTADPLGGGYVIPRYTSNQIAANTLEPFSAAYWDTTEFNNDQEVYATLAVLPAGAFRLYLGIQDEGGSGMDAYELEVDATNWYLQRMNDSGRTLLENLGARPAAGTAIRLRRIGDKLFVFSKASGASSWTLVHSETDPSPLTGPGFISLWFQNDETARITNFGGGNVTGPVVSVEVVTELTPASLTRSRAQGAPTVSPSLGPASLTRTRVLGDPSIPSFVEPASLTRTRVIGDASVTVEIKPVSLTRIRSLSPAPTVSPTVVTSSLTRTRVLGDPALEVQLGPNSLTRTRELGTPQLNPSIVPASLTHTRVIGDPTAQSADQVLPASLVRTRAIGTPTIYPNVFPDSLVRTRVLGTPEIPLTPTSLVRTRVLGDPTVNVAITLESLTHTRVLGDAGVTTIAEGDPVFDQNEPSLYGYTH